MKRTFTFWVVAFVIVAFVGLIGSCGLLLPPDGTDSEGGSGEDGSDDGDVDGDGDSTLDSSVDEDQDNIPDVDEINGWSIDIYSTVGGEPERVTVTSDPTKKDTDGDGLSDWEEKTIYKSDPSCSDTDGDGVLDFDEVKVYQSKAFNVDSDGDSKGNPNLFDYAEINTHRTSPISTDTDGDGLTDYDEIVESQGHPLIADLPKVRVWTHSASIFLDYETSTSTETTSSELVSTMNSSEVNTVAYDATNTRIVNEDSSRIYGEVEASYGGVPSVSAKVGTEVSSKQTTANEVFTSFTEDSTEASQATFESYSSTTKSTEVKKLGGRLTLSLMLENIGELTFEMEDLEITVLYRSATNPSGYDTIGSAVQATVDQNYVLEPGDTVGPLAFEISDLEISTAERIMSNPQSIVFDVVNYNLLDADANAYAFLSGAIDNKTGAISIDYGDGRVEKHQIATNTRYSNGSAAGVPLSEVFPQTLGLDFEVTEDGGIVRIGDTVTALHANPDALWQDGFWAVFGTDDNVDFETSSQGDIVLRAGEGISLVYLKDTDRDRLFDREEALHNTNPRSKDSDGDGLLDYEEISGWIIEYQGNDVHVFSSPTMTDTDGDGLSDSDERNRQLHPRVASPAITSADLARQVTALIEDIVDTVMLKHPRLVDQDGDGFPEKITERTEHDGYSGQVFIEGFYGSNTYDAATFTFDDYQVDAEYPNISGEVNMDLIDSTHLSYNMDDPGEWNCIEGEAPNIRMDANIFIEANTAGNPLYDYRGGKYNIYTKYDCTCGVEYECDAEYWFGNVTVYEDDEVGDWYSLTSNNL